MLKNLQHTYLPAPKTKLGWFLCLFVFILCICLEKSAIHLWRFQLGYLACSFIAILSILYITIEYKSRSTTMKQKATNSKLQSKSKATGSSMTTTQSNDLLLGAIAGLLYAATLLDRTSVLLHSLLFVGLVVPLMQYVLLTSKRHVITWITKVVTYSKENKTFIKEDVESSNRSINTNKQLNNNSNNNKDEEDSIKIERISLAVLVLIFTTITTLLTNGKLYGLCSILLALSILSLIFISIERIAIIGTCGIVGLLFVAVLLKHIRSDTFFNECIGMTLVGAIVIWRIKLNYSNRINLGNELVSASMLALPLSLPPLFVLYCMLAATNPWWLYSASMNKYSLLQPSITPSNVSLHALQIQSMVDLENLTYPLIFKPNECTTSSRGVTPIYNHQEALQYILQRDQSHAERTTLAQEFFQGPELSIFYFRFPYLSHGFIKTLGVRLKEKDGFKSTYGISTRNDLITPELIQFFDELTIKMGVFSARLDTMVSSFSDLKIGKDLKIIDVNGNAIGCIDEKPVHLFNKEKYNGLANTLRRLRTTWMQMYIGLMNVVVGNAKLIDVLVAFPQLIARHYQCPMGRDGNVEHLLFARE